MTPLYIIKYKYKGIIKQIQVKDESKNIYTNSIKDRPAKYIIEEAYKNNEINKESIICEVTSGNMGIALAKVCKDYDNKVIILMPKFVSIERRKKLEELDAKIILQVHDELLLEVKDEDVEKAEIILKRNMENAFKLNVPLMVETNVAKTWYDVK